MLDEWSGSWRVIFARGFDWQIDKVAVLDIQYHDLDLEYRLSVDASLVFMHLLGSSTDDLGNHPMRGVCLMI